MNFDAYFFLNLIVYHPGAWKGPYKEPKATIPLQELEKRARTTLIFYLVISGTLVICNGCNNVQSAGMAPRGRKREINIKWLWPPDHLTWVQIQSLYFHIKILWLLELLMI